MEISDIAVHIIHWKYESSVICLKLVYLLTAAKSLTLLSMSTVVAVLIAKLSIVPTKLRILSLLFLISNTVDFAIPYSPASFA